MPDTKCGHSACTNKQQCSTDTGTGERIDIRRFDDKQQRGNDHVSVEKPEMIKLRGHQRIGDVGAHKKVEEGYINCGVEKERYGRSGKPLSDIRGRYRATAS